MACDYVINLEIKDEGEKTNHFVKLPKGALIDEKFRGLNSQEVFNLLTDEECGGSGEGSLDEHDWDKAQSMSQEEKEQFWHEAHLRTVFKLLQLELWPDNVPLPQSYLDFRNRLN